MNPPKTIHFTLEKQNIHLVDNKSVVFQFLFLFAAYVLHTELVLFQLSQMTKCAPDTPTTCLNTTVGPEEETKTQFAH